MNGFQFIFLHSKVLHLQMEDLIKLTNQLYFLRLKYINKLLDVFHYASFNSYLLFVYLT